MKGNAIHIKKGVCGLVTDMQRAEAIRRMMLDLAESLKAGVSG